jgi:hypothetical protein
VHSNNKTTEQQNNRTTEQQNNRTTEQQNNHNIGWSDRTIIISDGVTEQS